MGSDAFSDILSLGASNVAKLAIFIFIIAATNNLFVSKSP